MRRVGPHGVASGKTRIAAALGAVTVQDTGFGLEGALRPLRQRAAVERADRRAHGYTRDTKRERGGEIGQRFRGRLAAAGVAGGNDADIRPARRLATRELDDVAKRAACRLAEDV